METNLESEFQGKEKCISFCLRFFPPLSPFFLLRSHRFALCAVLRYDPTDDPKEYIHRVGRTARGTGKAGKALLFLLPEEMAFLRYLKAAKIPVTEFEFPKRKICNVQAQLEKLIESNYYLHQVKRVSSLPLVLTLHTQKVNKYTIPFCIHVYIFGFQISRLLRAPAPPIAPTSSLTTHTP